MGYIHGGLETDCIGIVDRMIGACVGSMRRGFTTRARHTSATPCIKDLARLLVSSSFSLLSGPSDIRFVRVFIFSSVVTVLALAPWYAGLCMLPVPLTRAFEQRPLEPRRWAPTKLLLLSSSRLYGTPPTTEQREQALKRCFGMDFFKWRGCWLVLNFNGGATIQMRQPNVAVRGRQDCLDRHLSLPLLTISRASLYSLNQFAGCAPVCEQHKHD